MSRNRKRDSSLARRVVRMIKDQRRKVHSKRNNGGRRRSPVGRQSCGCPAGRHDRRRWGSTWVCLATYKDLCLKFQKPKRSFFSRIFGGR